MKCKKDFFFPATCPISSTRLARSKKLAVLTLGSLLAILLLMIEGAALGNAQNNRPGMVRTTTVPHVNVMRPSSSPLGASQAHGSLVTRMLPQSNLTPVNTGPGIVYTCDASISSATCNYLNTTVAGYYNATFTNANANIYIQYGSTGLGASLQAFNFATYSQYVTAYGNIANKSNIQVSAQSALSTYDAMPYGSDYVGLTAALATALGFTGVVGVTTSETICTLGSAGCYNAIVTITNNPGITLYYDNLGGTESSDAYDFYAVVEHETDEVLGTSSCVTTQTVPLSDGCDAATKETGTPSAVDLFRYSSAGNLVLDSSLSTSPGAYFSFNGGSTNGANGLGGTGKFYNTQDNGDDYADFVPSVSNCATNLALQDATGCPGHDAGLTILNDGDSEINILTAVGYGVPPSTSACTSPNPNPNPNPESFSSTLDFNGDCKSDILWRNSSTEQVYAWLMNGTSVGSTGSPGSPASNWVIQGAGDFNGDGKADILWRDSTTGQIYVWFMNGASIASSGSIGYISSNWTIQGIGDFNGDGKADILWRDSNTGQVYIWLMNGTTISGGGAVSYVGSNWTIQGIGDFNGDGKADILWRDSNTGQVYIWLMNGTTISGGAAVSYVSSNWSIQGIGDFNGDGKSDILWRDSNTGQVYTWLMNGTTRSGGGAVSYVSSSWSIQDIGDFNGDGEADILWRNSTTGEVYIWLMNGTSVVSTGSLGNPATEWHIAP